MEIKSYEDILNLQKDLSARFAKNMEALAKPGPKAAAFLVDLKLGALKDAQVALASAQQAREETVQRLDAEVARHTQVVAQLKSEIEELQKAQAQQPTPAPQSPSPQPPTGVNVKGVRPAIARTKKK